MPEPKVDDFRNYGVIDIRHSGADAQLSVGLAVLPGGLWPMSAGGGPRQIPRGQSSRHLP